jgi:hypothetical protein
MIARCLIFVTLAAATLFLMLPGCGPSEPVTIGEGEVPGPVPDDFPVPAGAVVGSTRIDRVGHRTEFTLTVVRTVSGVTQYYLVSLVSAGYVVVRSGGDDTLWNISFSRDSLRGTVVIEPAGAGAAEVVVSINRP